MLYQMGILANVAFIEESRNRAYDSPEKAHASVRWMFGELDSAEEERLHTYVRENLVIRGGCWHGSANSTRCAARRSGLPDSMNDDLGFRVVREP